MRTDITCTLNGAGLTDLDSRIYIEDITEEVTVSQETIQRAHYGMFPMNNPGRESIAVKVKFMIKEKDRTNRMSVIQAIRGWAREGWFTMNTRPGQQLYVFCTKPPAIETHRKERAKRGKTKNKQKDNQAPAAPTKTTPDTRG